MNSIHTTLGAAVWTYSAAFFAMFVANVSTFTAVLGFVLVLLRFTYEVPRAIKAIRSWRDHRKNAHD